MYLSRNDTVWASETCSVASKPDVDFAIQHDVEGFDGTSTLMLESTLPLALGGRYKLCWCGGNSLCSNVVDFFVEAGELVLQGPSLGEQDRTCVSGRTCLVDGIVGQGLLDSDTYLMQDACGSNQILRSTVNAGQDVRVVASGAVVIWGNASHTLAGGLYKLCWCRDWPMDHNTSSLCASAESYLSTVGNLAMRGPAPLQQDRTCVSGEVCKLEDLSGFLFDPTRDSVMVLDTCGFLRKKSSSSETVWTELETGGILHFGLKSIVMTGGTYRLCWCGADPSVESNSTRPSNRSGCTFATDFQVDFGALHVVGPLQRQEDSTCVSGQVCHIWHVPGHFMDFTNSHFLVLDTCSMPMGTRTGHFKQIRENSSLSFSANISSSILVLEDMPMIGGQYRLCWCGASASSGCSGEDAFATDAGRISVLGPSPLQQDRTCISGRSCVVEDIIGVGLSTGNQAMILDTCSVASHLHRIPQATSLVLANRSSFVWKMVSAKGGRYRLCWCADPDLVALARIPVNPDVISLKNCASPLDFNVDFGSLDLIGPVQVEQTFTCVSGQTCVLKGAQYDMTLGDSVLVLDSCGTMTSLVPHSLQKTALASPQDSSFSWGSAHQTPQGGIYRLCWCSPRSEEIAVNVDNVTDGSFCQTADHFVVDFGSLHVLGPVSTHSRTCVVGWPCHISGLNGNDLQSGDGYLILDTCGLASHIPHSPAGFLQSAAGTFGTEVSFVAAVSSSGGTYRICWCAQGFHCHSYDDFRVDAGELVLQGILPDQAFTCVRGRPCRVSHVQGVYLESQRAEFLIMATCASNPGSLISSTQAIARAVPGTDAWWEMTLTLQGGKYRLCWCADLQDGRASWADNSTISPHEWQVLSGALPSLHGPFNSTDYNKSSCRHPDFRVDVGELHLIGPASGNAFTCISGRACAVNSIRGNGLSSNDSYLVLDTCGIPTTVPRFSSAGWPMSLAASGAVVSWGEVAITAAGGEYRLCWCKETIEKWTSFPNSYNDSSSCKSATNFISDVGKLHLIGVDLEQPRTCVSGSYCLIDGITGANLQDEDALLVLDTCGLSGAPPNIYHVTGEKPVRAFSNASGIAWYWDLLEAPILGGEYRLCWCSGLDKPCSLSVDFQVDFGKLFVQGPRPLQQSFTCISGQECNIGMTGEGRESKESFMILSTCGSTAGNIAVRKADMAYLDTDTSIAKLELQGGTYRLCWCPSLQFSAFPQSHNGSDVNLSQILRCETPLDFTIDFGRLEVIGVTFSQDRTCISGQTCSMDSLLGLHLSNSDAWRVFDTCGFQDVVGFPGDAQVLVEVQGDWVSSASVSWNTPLTLHGGTYRLCWCSRAGNLTNATHQCSRFDTFVDAGKLEVLGPSGQIPWTPTQRGHCGRRPQHPEPKILEVFGNLTHEECRSRCEEVHLCQLSWYSDQGQHEGECKIMETCTSIADDSEPSLLLLPPKAEPRSFQSQTCISGQTCAIHGLLGNGLTEGDSYMLLDTCSFASALVAKIGKAGVALLSGSLNSTRVDISWESRISAPGGSYRLCWCGAYASCSSSESFRADVGSFLLLGPSLQQDKTCVSGHSCVVDGIRGHNLADGDRLWILDTCGTRSAGEGLFADSWLSQPAVASGTSFFWDSLDTLPGGQYRLCWCNGQSSCMTSDAFAVDVGELVMQGPFFGLESLQMRTCVSGQVCEIDGLNGLLLDGFIWILDSCGSAETSPKHGAKAALVTNHRASWSMLSAQGGQYQLCWCPGSSELDNISNSSNSQCLTGLSFTLHFGTLMLVGPYASQEFTCISGQSCAISGIQGQGLDPTDKFLVLETCGTPSGFILGPAETVPLWIPLQNRTELIDTDWSWGFYEQGNLSWAQNQSGLQLSCLSTPSNPECRAMEPILGVAWKDPLNFVDAGKYQLCWCAPERNTQSMSSCDSPEGFRISVGSMTIRGPRNHQDRTCVSGQTCAFGDIYGIYIHPEDRFMILDTCGSPFLPPGVIPLGIIEANDTLEEGMNFTRTNITKSDTAVRVTWAPDTFSGPGGIYRLCWCAAGFECDQKNGLHFRTDVGTLSLLGPSANFNQYDRWLRGFCSVQQRDSLHRNISQDDCFSLARHAGHRIMAAQFEENMPSSCSLLSRCDSFSSTDGSPLEVLFLQSSAAQHRTCISGLTCSVDAIEGLGLSSADSFAVLDACGDASFVEGFPSDIFVREIADSVLANASNYTAPWAARSSVKMYVRIIRFEISTQTSNLPGVL